MEEIEAVPAVDSRFEGIRRKVAEVAHQTTLDLDIPDYNGILVARYRILSILVDGKLVRDRLTRQFPDEERRGFYSHVDTLIEACVGVYERLEDGELRSLDCRYDATLVKGLGLDQKEESARGALLAVFRHNEPAVVTQSVRLQQWMADPSKRVALGEA